MAPAAINDQKEERTMSKLRVNCFSLSLEGFGAGPEQGIEHPLGRGGESLHQPIAG
jgi:hypothetical protein